MKLIKKDKSVAIEQMAKECSVSTKTIKRDIVKLKEAGKLELIDSLKSGHWKAI
ncbi:MAG: DeoR family transcriptional regulator [Epsilonproteobacteria bacterium]|nr:DeoR family transcriptional regulator [Campylobacterota bacterium]